MQVLKKPLLTEKVTAQNEKGVYGFIVDVAANKIQIKKAVEDLYQVSVKSVRTIRYAGKAKTKYTKSSVISGRTSAFKKAIVTLTPGEYLDLYENI